MALAYSDRAKKAVLSHAGDQRENVTKGFRTFYSFVFLPSNRHTYQTLTHEFKFPGTNPCKIPIEINVKQ